MSERPNVSSDLIWEVVRPQNAYLVKRKSGGGAQFSRDPLNLANKHSRTHAGFINDKAVGILPHQKGGVTMITKKSKNSQKPASHEQSVTWGSHYSNQKTYKGVASHVAKTSYRSDLRAAAVSRASAIIESQRPKKDAPEKKPRGSKAKKVEE